MAKLCWGRLRRPTSLQEEMRVADGVRGSSEVAHWVQAAQGLPSRAQSMRTEHKGTDPSVRGARRWRANTEIDNDLLRL